MGGGKLPPRQKMIGMMYLVLTALLAMNVSKSILDSFITINNGIVSTAETFIDKNAFLYAQFDGAATDNKVAAHYRDLAYDVKEEADSVYNYIQALKSKLIEITDKKTPQEADSLIFDLKSVDAKDNYDEPTRIMGLAEPAKSVKVKGLERWSALVLKEKLNNYKTNILAVFEDEKDRNDIEGNLAYLNTPDLPADEGHIESWESVVFYHIPLAATITMLSKIQSDVRTAEAEIIAKLYEHIDAGGVSFNKVDGFAYAPKAYVMVGDTFKAQIFTAAYDDRQNPEIFIYSNPEMGVDSAAWKKGETDAAKLMRGEKGNNWDEGDWFELKDVREGKGFFKVKAGMGVHDWGGIIKIKTKKGPKIYPFQGAFEVGKPTTTIAASKMNVFYMGVDNPVSVSAPMKNFSASAPGLRKTSKGWIMKPTRKGNVTIRVTGTTDEGKKVALGKEVFRVKRIPDPKSYVSGKGGSTTIRKAQFKSSSTVQAKMEGFDFDLKVRVKSFTFSTTKSGGLIDEVKVKGDKLNAKCKKMINGAKRNQKFYIEKIMVVMPDRTKRELAPIILKVI